MIQFSPAALSEIQRMQKKQLKQTTGYLRLSMTEGGCAGWIYKLTWTTTPTPQEQQVQTQGIQVLIETQQLSWLQGLTLDYSEDLMGGGFRFHNPQAQQTCGCGQSFTPKPSSSELSNVGADI